MARAYDPEAARQAREQKLVDMHEQLATKVAELTDSDQWAAWLTAAAKFHQYSFSNQLLIWSQNPEATHVAGFGRWKDMGRSVNKGEHGIAILAPMTVRTAVPDNDPHSEGRRLRGKEAPRPGEHVKHQVLGYKPAYVFDIDQTSGQPLPGQDARTPTLLEGQAPPGLWASLTSVVEAHGFTVSRGDPGSRANGVTNYPAKTVVVRADVDDAQAVKTLAHETAHVMLHGPQDDDEQVCRGQREVEAESTAYLVVHAHGLDSAPYTVAYVGGWAQAAQRRAPEGTTLADVITQTGQRVVKTANTILETTRPTSSPAEQVSARQPAVQREQARRHAGRDADGPAPVRERLRDLSLEQPQVDDPPVPAQPGLQL
jgi:hypothetical protein